MWCTPPEQHRADRTTGATKQQQHQPVFAAIPAHSQAQPEPQRRPVRVPPQSPLAFPRLASENPGSLRYTQSDRQCVAAMVAKLRRGDDLRGDKVATIREDVTVGDHDNEMKLGLAIDRLLDELVVE